MVDVSAAVARLVVQGGLALLTLPVAAAAVFSQHASIRGVFSLATRAAIAIVPADALIILSIGLGDLQLIIVLLDIYLPTLHCRGTSGC